MTQSISRLNYFQNQPLSAGDMTLEQHYHHELFRLRNKGYIRAGIAHGLLVQRFQPGLIKVLPGLAIDGLGNLLFLSSFVAFDLANYDADLYYIAISANPKPTALSDQTGTPGYKRIDMEPMVQLLTRITDPEQQILLGMAGNTGNPDVDQIQNQIGERRRRHIGLQVTSVDLLPVDSDPEFGAGIRLVQGSRPAGELLIQAEKLELTGFFVGSHDVSIGRIDNSLRDPSRQPNLGACFAVNNRPLPLSGIPSSPIPPGDGDLQHPYAEKDTLLLRQSDGTTKPVVVHSSASTEIPASTLPGFLLLKSRVASFLNHDALPVFEFWDDGYFLFGRTSSAAEVANSFDLDEPEASSDSLNGHVLSITPKGRVGIGTLRPSAELDVRGTVSAISFMGDGSKLQGVTGLWSPVESSNSQNEPLLNHLDSDSAIAANIYETGGWVGIGLDDPSAELHLVGFQPTSGVGTLSNLPGSPEIWGSNTAFTREVAVGNLLLVGNLSGDDPKLLQQCTVISISSDSQLTLDQPFDPPLTDSCFQLLQPSARFFQPGNDIPALALMPKNFVGINKLAPEVALDVGGSVAVAQLNVDDFKADTLTVNVSATVGGPTVTAQLLAASGSVSADTLTLSDLQGPPALPASLQVGASAVTLSDGLMTAAQLQLGSMLTVGSGSTQASIQNDGLHASTLQLSASLTIGPTASPTAQLSNGLIACQNLDATQQLSIGGSDGVSFLASPPAIQASQLTAAPNSWLELSHSPFQPTGSVQLFGQPVSLSPYTTYIAPCDGYLVGSLIGAIQVVHDGNASVFPLNYLIVTVSTKKFLGITIHTDVYYNYYPRSYLIPVAAGNFMTIIPDTKFSNPIQSNLWVPCGQSAVPPTNGQSIDQPPPISTSDLPGLSVSLIPVQSVLDAVNLTAQSQIPSITQQLQTLKNNSVNGKPPAGYVNTMLQSIYTSSLPLLSASFDSASKAQLESFYQQIVQDSADPEANLQKLRNASSAVVQAVAAAPGPNGTDWRDQITQLGHKALFDYQVYLEQDTALISPSLLAKSMVGDFYRDLQGLLLNESAAQSLYQTTLAALQNVLNSTSAT